jgi:thiamine-phosphate diphosphorylase
VNVPILHVIATDEVAEAATFLADAGSLVAAGRDRIALHLRLRRTDGRDLHHLAVRLGSAAADSGAWCVINDRIDVALTSGAQAVQLGRGSLPVDAVHRLRDGRFVIGASVHSAGEARRKAAAGADFLVAGSVFSTATHPRSAPAGTALVTSCLEAGVPVVGIGGIHAGNARQVLKAGASGIAVIRAVWQAANPVGEALRLIELCAQQESEGVCFS